MESLLAIAVCDRPAQPAEGKTFYVDCASGDDTHAGTKLAPFATVAKAQTASRSAGAGTQVFLRAGTCYLKSTLLLGAADSGVSWSTFDSEAVVLSGGASLNGIKWSPYKGKIMVADLPEGVNASAIDSLFTVPKSGGPGGAGAIRHVRARYPNGDSEVDRMPTNYDKLGGGAGATQSWVAAGAKSERFPSVIRNSSYYPWFGHSNDLRWVLDYHTENQSSYYRPEWSFWQAGIGTGAKYTPRVRYLPYKSFNLPVLGSIYDRCLPWSRYNASTFSPRVADWTNVDDVVLHVIHYDWWGNWQWKLDSIDVETQVREMRTTFSSFSVGVSLSIGSLSQTMEFGFGGFQDAHGGPVASNYFFAENVLQELDAPSEWYVDRHAGKVYFWPPAGGSTSDLDLVVSQLQTVLRIEG